MADNDPKDPNDARTTLPPTSEVGSGSSAAFSSEQFKLLLEMQNQSLVELIKSMTKPVSPSRSISLPKFNPENSNADSCAWCATVDMCLVERPLEGSSLVIALSEALQGSASTWLSQVCYPGITWTDFKDLFITRFAGMETSAATLINLQNSRPKDGECLASYSSRLLASLMSKWKNLTAEEIAVSVVLAHNSQFDSRLQRLAFTTDVKTRIQLQKELKAFSYTRKRPTSSQDERSSSDFKKFKSAVPIKCHSCGKMGHKSTNCLSTANQRKPESSPNNQVAVRHIPMHNKPVTCYKCGRTGHIASKCQSTASSMKDQGSKEFRERRVDFCTVAAPSGSLIHRDAPEDV
ncbi:uncharacterized protein LOC141537232 [Cotesia typhae]|uniref:uncharacterized protein LOC141537232 n=3 Tax=Cotesia typhae TaxID=2053667 RepID=UPI003D6946C3